MEIAIIALVVVIFAAKFTIKIVPQQNAWIVERLGKYSTTLTVQTGRASCRERV